jgi:hypothetical protein
MAFEARLACGALALGLALVAVALFVGCEWGDESSDEVAEEVTSDAGATVMRPPVGTHYDSYEMLPGCPDKTRGVNFDHATIVEKGRVVRLYFATSSSFVPCGFVAGDNGRVMVLELRATNPRVALADLNGRCVDAVLASSAESELEVISTRPHRGPAWSLQARAEEVGPDRDCPDVRPIPGATIEVD